MADFPKKIHIMIYTGINVSEKKTRRKDMARLLKSRQIVIIMSAMCL